MANTIKVISTKAILSNRAIRLGVDRRLSMLDALVKVNEHFGQHERKAAVAGKIIECRGYVQDDDVIGLHFVAYIPDDKIGVVPHNKADLDLIPPPLDADFLDGELMILVSHDDMIVCRLGLWESAVATYLEVLAPQAGIDPDDASFGFKNRTDVDKLKKIKDDGVKEIKFEGVASKAAVDHIADVEDNSYRKIVSGLLQNFRAVTFHDNAPPVSENLKVEVFLKFDSRVGTDIDQRELQAFATNLTEGDDAFQIITRSGERITPEEVILSKRVSVPRYGKSVAFNDVYKEMKEYYAELTTPGG